MKKELIFNEHFDQSPWTLSDGWSVVENEKTTGLIYGDIEEDEMYEISYVIPCLKTKEIKFLIPHQFVGHIESVSIRKVDRVIPKQRDLPKPRKKGWKKAMRNQLAMFGRFK